MLIDDQINIFSFFLNKIDIIGSKWTLDQILLQIYPKKNNIAVSITILGVENYNW